MVIVDAAPFEDERTSTLRYLDVRQVVVEVVNYVKIIFNVCQTYTTLRTLTLMYMNILSA